MVFSREDKILIKNLAMMKGYSSCQLSKTAMKQCYGRFGRWVMAWWINSQEVDAFHIPDNIDAEHDLALNHEDHCKLT